MSLLKKITKDTQLNNNMEKKLHKRIDTDMLQLYSLCVIPLLFLFVFNYIPMGGIIIAFKNYKFNLGILGSEWIGLRNFEYFVTSNDFARVAFNTIYMNVLFIVFGTLASIILAILLYDLTSRKMTKVFQTVLITPTFISWVVVGFMVYGLLNPSYGIVNGLLNKLGFKGFDWYTMPEIWPVILTAASIWKNVGMDCIIYYAFLMGMDETIFESANVDGANKLQRNIYIIFPSLLRLLTVLVVMKVGNIFRADFGLFYQLPRDVGALYKTTDVMDTYIYRLMRGIGDMGMSTAVSLLQSAVGIVMVMITNKVAKKVDPDGGLF